MKNKEKKQYPLNPKNIFGLSTMRWTVVAGTSLMTSVIMIYLTDYSGLANAAVVATTMLLICRIIDAVDNPLIGWIIDNSKKTKIGKFKPFLLGGIIVTNIALVALFSMPSNVAEWVKITFLYAMIIIYEIAFSLQPDYAIKATMTEDPKIREKLLITPRVVEQFIAVPFAFFITMALSFGTMLGGDNKAGFSLATIAFVVPIGIIAFIGACCVKEGPFVKQNEKKLGIKDIAKMFKENKPLWISQLSVLIGGCVFTFVMAAAAYYIKWAYGPENFGSNAAIFGMCTLFGMIAGTFLAGPMLKKLIPVHGNMLCNMMQIIPLGVIFLIQLMFGSVHIILFFALLFVMFTFAGMNYVPAGLINMECMDFNRWKTGTGMEALVQSVNNFTIKAQTAFAGLATGAVLIAIHYNATLYESASYIASGGTIPPDLLLGLLVVCCLIPVALGIASTLILIPYPLKREMRDRMYKELEQKNAKG